MIETKHVCLLNSLGLTLLQAKVYLALAYAGKATITTISKTADVARQDVYRIMPTLEKIGLVERMLTTPVMYQALSLREGYCLLLQNLNRKHSELQKKTSMMLETLNDESNTSVMRNESAQFIVTSSQKLFHKKIGEAHMKTQKSIRAIGNWKSIQKMLWLRSKDFQKLIQKGIEIRLITEKHNYSKAIRRIMDELSANPAFKIRFADAPVSIKAVIHDESEVNMCIALNPESYVPNLWSSNPQFVKVIAAYFEALWNRTQEVAEGYLAFGPGSKLLL
ncbi:MAG: helix-turn-helix domain-containing protein [Candidatus Bathyarchaeia archaeon]